jgi:L-aminopeptidase/D-esterase-like protein
MRTLQSTVALTAAIAGGVLCGGVMAQRAQTTPAAADFCGITRVPGIRVGHATMAGRPTGCTVIVVDKGATGGVDVRGGAPGTVETDLLRPDELVTTVNAVFLSGGSAFGLAVHDGVMKYLEEKGVGYSAAGFHVPIVPGAILFDLPVGTTNENRLVRPDANCGYRAAMAAQSGAIEEGSVGAGAGATVGKFGRGGAMKGGIGTASLTTTDGLIVGAIVAVNASGSIVDPRHGNEPVAGVRNADGKTLANPFDLLRQGIAPQGTGQNTTIGVIATNAKLTKAQALKVAEMAHDGMARTIVPSHTMSDGDTLFTLATGDLAGDADVNRIGVLAAEAVSDAILRAVRLAKGLPGYPSVSDIR